MFFFQLNVFTVFYLRCKQLTKKKIKKFCFEKSNFVNFFQCNILYQGSFIVIIRSKYSKELKIFFDVNIKINDLIQNFRIFINILISSTGDDRTLF